MLDGSAEFQLKCSRLTFFLRFVCSSVVRLRAHRIYIVDCTQCTLSQFRKYCNCYWLLECDAPSASFIRIYTRKRAYLTASTIYTHTRV